MSQPYRRKLLSLNHEIWGYSKLSINNVGEIVRILRDSPVERHPRTYQSQLGENQNMMRVASVQLK